MTENNVQENVNDVEYFCSQCGFETDKLHEGYCEACCEQRQEELDAYNDEYDWWKNASDEERQGRIDWAMR